MLREKINTIVHHDCNHQHSPDSELILRLVMTMANIMDIDPKEFAEELADLKNTADYATEFTSFLTKKNRANGDGFEAIIKINKDI